MNTQATPVVMAIWSATRQNTLRTNAVRTACCVNVAAAAPAAAASGSYPAPGAAAGTAAKHTQPVQVGLAWLEGKAWLGSCLVLMDS
jgi:hypothetical protein